MQYEGEVAIRCSNKQGCPAQVLRRLTHWVSKGAMDIDGIGPALLEQLVNANLLNSPADFYRLTPEHFLQLARMGEKSAQNAYQAIEASKTQPLFRLIHALGIRHVGQETAIVLADHFGSLKALSDATLDQLITLPGLGQKMAEAILLFFADETNQTLQNDLDTLGVGQQNSQTQPAQLSLLSLAESPTERPSATTKPLTGKTFVLTGTLPTLSREEAKTLIREAGGKISSAVSAKTDYLLAGEEAGSKLSKAQSLGVPILSETDLQQLLSGNQTDRP